MHARPVTTRLRVLREASTLAIQGTAQRNSPITSSVVRIAHHIGVIVDLIATYCSAQEDPI